METTTPIVPGGLRGTYMVVTTPHPRSAAIPEGGSGDFQWFHDLLDRWLRSPKDEPVGWGFRTAHEALATLQEIAAQREQTMEILVTDGQILFRITSDWGVASGEIDLKP